MHLLLISLAAALAVCQNPPKKPAEVEEFWPNGNLKSRYTVDESNRKNGPSVECYEDGKMKIRTSWREGELDGAFEEWYPGGQLKIRTNYKKGKLDGPYNEKDDVTGRDIRASFREGRKHGRVEITEKRKSISTQEWKSGELLSLNGVVPFPRSAAAVRDGLARIKNLPAQEGFQANDERLQALRRLQQYRFLCDVPWEGMSLDPAMNEATLWAAKICKALGRLDHTPPNPGWPEKDYKKAYEGTSHSNLSAGSGIVGSIDSYMDDSDPSNVDRVGHRRWCLNPRMLKTGFGGDGGWSAMWSMDASRAKVPPLEFIAYPAPGYFPREYFHKNAAWSLSLLSGKLAPKSAEKTKIHVTPLDEWYAPARDALTIQDFKINQDGYGMSNCMIFRPVGVDPSAGMRYFTEIDLDGDGNPELRYLVEFTVL
jgi:hypothetical protein